MGSLSGALGSITNNGIAAAALTVNNAVTTTYAGTLADGANPLVLNVQGGGTLVLTGSNGYSGGTNIVNAAVSVTQDANLGTASSPLYLNAGTLNITSPGEGKAMTTTTHPLSWGSGGATFNIADAANVFTLSQPLVSGSGDLVKTGPGTLWLNATTYSNRGTLLSQSNGNGAYLYAGANYTGSTRILGGSVVLDYTGDGNCWANSDSPCFQPIGAGPLVMGNATLSIYTLTPNVNYGSIQGWADIIPPNVFSGMTVLPGVSTLQVPGSILGCSINLNGGYLTGGTSTVTRQAGGCLNLQGSVGYNTSPNCVSPGGVTAWITTNTFRDAGDVTVPPTPGFEYWETEFAGGSPVIQPNIASWAAGEDVTNAWFSYTDVSNTWSYTVAGANSFSGSLPSNLAIDSLRILPAAASNINLGGHTLTISSGGILVTFNAVNASGNVTEISGGTVTAGNYSYGGDLIVQQYNAASAYPQYSPTGGPLLISAAIVNAPNPVGGNGNVANGSAVVSGLSYSTSGLYAGMPVSGAGIPAGATILAIDDSATITLSLSATASIAADNLSFQSANGLTIAGSGQTILTGANSYTGPTTIGGGTLQVGDGTNASAIGPGAVTNYGTLAFDPGPAGLTVANAINGTGTLVKLGGNTLVLSGASGYSGGTTVSGGTLQLGDGQMANGTIAGNVGVAASATLAFTNPFPQSFSGVVSGAGSLIASGPGLLTIPVADTYSGGTTVSGGTLQLGDGATTNGTIVGNVVDNATLAFANPFPQSFPGVVSGTGRRPHLARPRKTRQPARALAVPLARPRARPLPRHYPRRNQLSPVSDVTATPAPTQTPRPSSGDALPESREALAARIRAEEVAKREEKRLAGSSPLN